MISPTPSSASSVHGDCPPLSPAASQDSFESESDPALPGTVEHLSFLPSLHIGKQSAQRAESKIEPPSSFLSLADTPKLDSLPFSQAHQWTVCTDTLLGAPHTQLANPPTPVRAVMSSAAPATSAAPAGGAAPASASPAAAAAPTGKLWQASAVAEPFQQAVKDSIAARVSAGKRRPKLVGILATRSAPSIAYAEWTRKACDSVGIDFAIWKTWEDSAEAEKEDPAQQQDAEDYSLEADVEDLIIAANADSTVNGIMVYYPIFGGRRDTYLQQIVDPRKDVEGLHFSYCWNMYHNVRWLLPSQVGRAPGTYTELDASTPAAVAEADAVPKGYAKSILPCTPLAVVKCMEAMGVYDGSLPYGDRLYGKTITVINRSEVVGRPLAALLANDGARVLSIDIDSIQEFNKRPQSESASAQAHQVSSVVRAAREHNAARRLRPHHTVRPCSLSAEECIRQSHVVIGGVPSASYKVRTEWIKEGATCINFSSEKNFENDVRTRAAQYLPAIGKTTIAMLQRNLLRLLEYRDIVAEGNNA